MDDLQLQTCLDVVDGNKPLGVWDQQPAVPATGVAVTNTSGFAMGVEISGGTTLTAIKVDGVTIGGATARTTGRFRVRNGSTIAWVGAGAPAWQWFYE